MKMEAHRAVTAVSKNDKTGPITVTRAGKQSCPPTCPLLDECYADGGFVAMDWRKLTAGERGTDCLDTHCGDIEAASRKTRMVRFYVMGDTPENRAHGVRIFNAPARGSKAWGYTHRLDDVAFYQTATDTTVNASANNGAHADKYMAEGIPTVCFIAGEKKSLTPEGRAIVRCPAEYREDVNCATCGNGKPLCWRRDRNFAVGFTPHGKGKLTESAERVRDNTFAVAIT